MTEDIRAERAAAIARMREESFTDQVSVVVQRLERLVADVQALRFRERYGEERTAVTRAAEITHELTWGLANCDLQGLMKRAAEADAAAAEEVASA